MSKKCIVLDLDNTLWGGVAGEDGFSGIELGLDPPGSYFVAFQQALIDLYNQGIILAVNSKNNLADAMEVIRKHPNMILKEKHFAAMRVNWGDKAENLRELARELKIGLDSMIFLDDDPANRFWVRKVLPEVETPDLPEDSSGYVRFLRSLPYFKKDIITDEDKMRGSFYVTERLRREQEKKFSSREDFLKSLGTEVNCFVDDDSCVSRLAQLTEKTNQFNINKRPLTEEEIKGYIIDDGYAVFHASAADSFGNHGVIAFALAKKGEEKWIVESLLMSCRILGRGIEEAFLESIRRQAAKNGAGYLEILFVPSEKNEPAREFVGRYLNAHTILSSASGLMPSWVRLHIHGKT